MNEREATPESASNPLYRSAVVFVAGIALGALMMVEIVPASSMVEIADIGTAPTDGETAPDGSDGETLAGGGEGTSEDGPQVTRQGGTGEQSSGNDGSSGSEGSSGNSGNDGSSGNDGNDGNGGNGGNGGTEQSGVECAPGRNGGATDPEGGVSATEIYMATTVVESGIGSSFLGETRFAMDAVANRVNRDGGICGRQLTIEYSDDGWSPDRGAQFLRNFLNDGIFAVPVGPSSEGLNSVIKVGDFDKHKVPVVGTNGLSILQYERGDGSAQQWVWPVASATVSSARIMAKDAYDRMKQAGVEDPSGADFSVVFAHNYRFGEEGAEAFNAEVKRLTGDDIPGYEDGSTSCNQSYCALTAGDGTSSYSQQVTSFEEGEFVAMFLEPQTARAWMTDNNAPAAAEIPLGIGVAQPLFTKQFGDQCGTKCHTMLVWTGFKPNQEHYVSDPDVQRYVNDLQATNRNADPNNQFSLGAYIGMELLVEAIEAVGPQLTRDKLKQQLDEMKFDSGLTLADPMQFSPNSRYVATTMQAWEFQAVGSFSGWSAQQIVTDPQFED